MVLASELMLANVMLSIELLQQSTMGLGKELISYGLFRRKFLAFEKGQCHFHFE